MDINEEDLLKIQEEERPHDESSPFISTVSLIHSFLEESFVVLPFSFAHSGIFLSICMIIFVNLMSLAGLYFMSAIAAYVQNNSTASLRRGIIKGVTYRRASMLLTPRLRIPIDSTITAYSIGTAVCTLKVICEECMHLIDQYNRFSTADIPAFWSDKRIVITVLAVLLTPFCFKQKLAESDAVPIVSVGGVIYLVILALYNYFKTYGLGPGKIDLSWNATPRLELVECFSIFVYTFTCHNTFFLIFNSAKRKTTGYMMLLSSISMLFVIGISTTFGATSYAHYGPEVAPHVFLEYEVNLPSILGRTLYIIMLLFTCPPLIIMSRDTIVGLIRYEESVENLDEDEDAELPYHTVTPVETIQGKRGIVIGYFINVILLALTAALAVLPIPIDLTMKFIGTTACPLISFILPPIYYLNCTNNNGRTNKRALAWSLIAVSTITTVISLSALISELVNSGNTVKH